MHRFIFILSILVFLSGCFNSTAVITSNSPMCADIAYNQEVFDTKNKSLVVFSYDSTGILSDMDLYIHLKGVDNNDIPMIEISGKKKYPITMMLSPGVYKISNIYLLSYWDGEIGHANILDLTDQYSFSEIEVRPGELVYIGHIIVNTEKSKERRNTFLASLKVEQIPEKFNPFIKFYEEKTNKKAAFRIIKAEEGESK